MRHYLEMCTGRCYVCSHFLHYIISIHFVYMYMKHQTRLQLADFIFLIFFCALLLVLTPDILFHYRKVCVT